MSHLSEKEIDAFRSTLETLRGELREQYELGKSAAGGEALDQSKIGRLSRMDAMQQQRIAESSLQNTEHRLRRVTKALAKIESGDFGYCDECGEPIDTARLKARPEAPYCLRCQSALED